MSTNHNSGADHREQVKAIVHARILAVMTRKIEHASTPDQARAVASEMFALIERHGWTFATRGESEEATATASKVITFTKDHEGNPVGAIIQEQR